MTEATKRAYVDSLWDAYVKPFAPPELYEKDRTAAAFHVIDVYKAYFESMDATEVNRSKALSVCLSIWQLITHDKVGWLNAALTEVAAEGGLTSSPQFHLRFVFDALAKSLPPEAPQHLETATAIIPSALFQNIRDALSALGSGEVLPIFGPVDSGRNKNAWTWDQARLRAVEHVLFLTGQGITKAIARKRVADAMLSVSVETLRAWEERELKKPSAERSMGAAFAAGELTAQLRDDPDAWSAENAIDANIAFKMKQLSEESLKAFGGSYCAKFGQRHQGLR